MTFFRVGAQRPQLNTDRVLKNSISDSQAEFINDQLLTMNDLQIIRSIYILSSSPKMVDIRIKDRALRFLIQNIMNGKFEFKKGNTLVAFAQMMNHNHSIWFANSKDIRLGIFEANLI